MPVYLYLIGPLDMKAVFAYEKAKTVKCVLGPYDPCAEQGVCCRDGSQLTSQRSDRSR